VQLGMSALGQKRTYAAQQKNAYSITSVVARIDKFARISIEPLIVRRACDTG
jgi:hypothetical protein